jgi:hypothetical protein
MHSLSVSSGVLSQSRLASIQTCALSRPLVARSSESCRAPFVAIAKRLTGRWPGNF